jgi:hypothetical protein
MSNPQTKKKMNQQKLWRKSRLSECHANSFANGRTGAIYVIAFIMLAAFSIASCSSDDEDYNSNNLIGTWDKVEGVGVVSEGYVEYTFSNNGDCNIHVYDVFAGDTTIHRGYMLKDNRQLVIFEQMYGGAPEFEEWNIKKLSSNTMTWERTDNADIIYNFKRANH